MNPLFKRLLVRQMDNEATILARRYFGGQDVTATECYQLQRFNAVWRQAFTSIPFYRSWKEQHHLPDSIASLTELAAWPVLTKQELQAHPELMLRTVAPSTYAITSGSTGVPLRIPMDNTADAKANMCVGRAYNGIEPGARTFLIWGHEHLYGTGWRRLKNVAIRRIKDRILGYHRFSAYDTSVPAMRRAFIQYQSFRPTLVIGYSSSILSFVRANAGAASVYRPQLVLCTAGPLSEHDKAEVRRFFDAPLCMEYGSVECGVMAYTTDDCSRYDVFCHSHILQLRPTADGHLSNIVTNITDCYFPLIRYEIGDFLQVPAHEPHHSVKHIIDICGRPSDVVTLSDGTSFAAMLVEASVEHLDGIVAHQLVVVDACRLEILIVASRTLDEADFRRVEHDLTTVVPSLAGHSITVRQVERLLINKGGKTPIVIRQ